MPNSSQDRGQGRLALGCLSGGMWRQREKTTTAATTTNPPRENVKESKSRCTDGQAQPWSSPLREVPSVENFLAGRIGAVSRETISSSLIFLVLKEAGYCTFLCCIWPASKTPDPHPHIFLLKGQFSDSLYCFIWFD